MQSPFASKIFAHHKLFRRKHGYSPAPIEILPGESFDFDFVIPYTICKINEIEIVGCSSGDCADLFVYMGETKLNQFGFSVAMPDGSYRDTSEYDADLQAGLTVKVRIKNNQSVSGKYNINFTLHELVPVVYEVAPI